MRLIDADALGDDFRSDRYDCDGWYDDDDLDIALRRLEDAPTVDAVPVTRCKDCEYGWEYFDDMVYCRNDCGMDGEVPPDFYCASGKRRVSE